MIYAKRLAIDPKALIGKQVADIPANVKNECVIRDADSGEPVAAYVRLASKDAATARAAVTGIKQWSSAGRAGKWDSAAKTFGMAPRKAFRGRESCRAATFASEQPREHAALVSLADPLRRMMEGLIPESSEEDSRAIQIEISEEWRMTEKSNWTSGVVNRTAQLPYHRDAFNFDVWSAMPVIRSSAIGGFLSIPEYDICVECADGWAVFFRGYRHVHGVTPITKLNNKGYRYSIVFYALRGMKDCFTHALETSLGREKRTAREREMASIKK